MTIYFENTWRTANYARCVNIWTVQTLKIPWQAAITTILNTLTPRKFFPFANNWCRELKKRKRMGTPRAKELLVVERELRAPVTGINKSVGTLGGRFCPGTIAVLTTSLLLLVVSARPGASSEMPRWRPGSRHPSSVLSDARRLANLCGGASGNDQMAYAASTITKKGASNARSTNQIDSGRAASILEWTMLRWATR